MLFWFIGCSAAIIWNVFRDAGIDYRVLAAGSLLPDVADMATGHRVTHSLTVSVLLLCVLMLATIGRRMLRRRLLMLPIGMLLHLVLDGVFNSTRTFWWPVTGLSPAAGRIPSLQRGAMVNVVFEAIGLLIVRWFWKRFRLGNPAERAQFLRSGRLDARQ